MASRVPARDTAGPAALRCFEYLLRAIVVYERGCVCRGEREMTDRQTDRQTDTQTDTQTHTHTHRQTHTQTHTQTHRHVQTHRHTDAVNAQTGRQTHARQGDTETERFIH